MNRFDQLPWTITKLLGQVDNLHNLTHFVKYRFFYIFISCELILNERNYRLINYQLCNAFTKTF